MNWFEPRSAWRCLLGAVMLEILATAGLKAALGHPILYGPVLVGYVVSFALLGMALRRGLGLGRAYGAWGALGIVGTALVSWAVFDERIGIVMTVGFVVVVAGVWCVESGATRVSPGQAGDR